MKIIGHRGAKGLAPENTLKSLEKALEHNVDMIEIDVHVTRDGVPVLAHDDHIVLPDGVSLSILNENYETLLQHKADLTSLEEAIALIDKRVPLYIEIKERQIPGPIIAIILDFISNGWKADDFLFASYDFVLLRELHQALPDVPVVIGERWSGTRAVWRARRLGTRNISIQQLWLWRGFITSMHSSGWKLFAYTMNDPKRAKKFGRYGVYAIFTDYPDLYQK
jgi:glycerophosphoryl diester phosphodiesterase